MDIFAVEDNAGVGFHNNRRLGADGRAGRPVFDFVGLDGQQFPVFHSFCQFFRLGSLGGHGACIKNEKGQT
jgi:hypothetical protein